MKSSSLQFRITAGMLAVSLVVLWSAVLWVSHALRQGMETTIAAQQFSTVSLIASELDRSIGERQDILRAMAKGLDYRQLATPSAVQAALDAQPLLVRLFNWGILITDHNGMAVASAPAERHRAGIDFIDYPGVREALRENRELTTDPLFSPHSKQPLVAMIFPLHNESGAVVGLVIGVTNLAEPNFLDEIGTAKYGLTGDFLITAPTTRAYVASSDKRRVLQSGPARGINAVYDRYIDGEDGSGIARSSRGVVELSASKRIPATGWLMQSILPADEAFAPIERMQRQLFLLSGVLTVIGALLGGWLLRRQLRPLAKTARLLVAMREGRIPRQALPVWRNDEIGLLNAAFNGLQQVIIAEEGKAAEHTADQRIRRIVACIPGVVFQYRLNPDGHGKFTFISDGIRQLFGFTPDEAAENTELHRSQVHPDDRQRFFETLHEASEKLVPWRVEYRAITADGNIKWVLVDALPEAATDGDVIWHGFIADVTASKALEAELAEYHNHLEQLVNARTADLEQARSEAEHLARVKSDFLARMSHEIRTPLHGILGLVRIGLKYAHADNKAGETFAKISHSGKLLLGVLNDVLDFSKMEAGMLKIDVTTVELAPLLEDSIEMMQEDARAKGLALRLQRAPNLPAACRTDALRLRQILLNLLSNAIKFTRTGAVELSVSLEKGELLFSVADTGIGITAEQLEKIFRPFEQGDNTTTRRFGGTGLGLAITEHIVNLLDGRISVSSTPGQGSCFEVRLPYHPAELPIPACPALAASGAQPLQGMTLLVAEDMAINQEIMQELLADFGATTLMVNNGREAVEAVRQRGAEFAAVLMDIQMPVMNGHDATREILKLAPDLPVIGQTAHALAEEREACLASGMVGHIAKPINPDLLLAALLRHAHRRGTR